MLVVNERTFFGAFLTKPSTEASIGTERTTTWLMYGTAGNWTVGRKVRSQAAYAGVMVRLVPEARARVSPRFSPPWSVVSPVRPRPRRDRAESRRSSWTSS
ncbi:hypothetical protein NKH18_45185 [Streptomyces sp. M10(2022)]